MAVGSDAIDPADLHALVDGEIEDERRAVMLRRIAASPADRTCIEAWRNQNDLMRASFADVEREPIPAMLDLTARARLQCIPANDAPLVEPEAGQRTAATRHARAAAGLATGLVIAAGLGGSWFLLETSRKETSSASHIEAVATRSLDRSEPDTVRSASENGRRGLARLPITEIPDLHTAGFNFTGAETASMPPAILFRYEAGPERLVVKVARVENSAPSRFSKTAAGYEWVAHGTRFSVAGTLSPNRLRDMAAALRQGTASE